MSACAGEESGMDSAIMHTMRVQRRLDGPRGSRACGGGGRKPQDSLPAWRGPGQQLDIEQILEVVMDLVFEHVKADRGIILLLDEKTSELVPKVVRSRDETDAAQVTGGRGKRRRVRCRRRFTHRGRSSIT